MSSAKNLSFKRKAVLAVCVVLGCLVIALGALLPTLIPDSRGQATVERPSVTEPAGTTADPWREYESITAELYNTGVVIYANASTGLAFKRNLVVTGTYNNQPYTLRPEEYTITVVINNELIGDSDPVFPATDDIAENTKVDILVQSGSKSATIEGVPVKAAADIPEVADFTVSLPTIYTDSTAEDVARELTVNVVGGGQVVNRDLYTVSFSGANDKGLFAEGATAEVAVTYLNSKIPVAEGETQKTDKTVNTTATTTVQKATLQNIAVVFGAHLRKNENNYYEYEASYQKLGIEASDKTAWWSAFVAGMSQNQVLSSLDVWGYYPHSRKSLKAAEEGKYTDETIRNIAITQPQQFVAGERSVTVEVDRGTADTVKNVLSIPFEERAVKEIRAELKENVMTVQRLHSYGSLQKADINVWEIFNSGEKASEPTKETERYGFVSELLTPTATDIQNYIATSDKTNFKYDKDITVQYGTTENGTFSPSTTVPTVTVRVPQIVFDSISSIGAISGNLADQTALSDFDFSGLTIRFSYDDFGVEKNVPLADLKALCKVELFDSMGTLMKDKDGTPLKKLTRDVKGITITFDEGNTFGKGKKVKNFGVTDTVTGTVVIVNPARRVYPIVDFTAIDFSEEKCEKEITGLIAGAWQRVDNTYTWHNAEMAISFPDNNAEFVAGSADSETEEITTGTIKFLSGGEVKMNVTLTQGDAGNYRWAPVPTSELYIKSKDDYTLEYTFTINRADLDLTLDYSACADKNPNREYGSPAEPDGLKVMGKVRNSAVAAEEITDKWTTYPQDQDELGYKLFYYGWDDFTYDHPTDTFPANMPVGTYYVFAKTNTTKAYNASQTRLGNVKQFIVYPKALEPAAAVQTFTYTQGTSHALSDFVSTSISGVEKDDQITVTVAQYGTNAQTPPYTHAGTYPVQLTLGGDSVNNYVWKIPDTDCKKVNQTELDKLREYHDLSVEIKARKYNVSVTMEGFVYGTPKSDDNNKPLVKISDNSVTENQRFESLKTEQSITIAEAGTNNAAWNAALTNAGIQNDFYPTLTSIEFFDSENQPVTYGNRATWDAGTYTVKFTFGKNGSDQNKDVTLNEKEFGTTGVTVSADFTVSRSQIDPVSFTPSVATQTLYDENDRTVTLTIGSVDWQTATLHSGDTSGLAGAHLDVTVAYTAFTEGATQVTDNALFNNGIVTVQNAATYTVTVVPKTNYAWSSIPDGKESVTDAITYTYVITRKQLDKPTAPNAGTYTGASQNITLTGGNDDWTVMKITGVSGKTHGETEADKKPITVTTPDEHTATFAVTHAGEYTATVQLTDTFNYEWKLGADITGPTESDKVGDVTVAYTLNQQEITINWQKQEGGLLFYDYIEPVEGVAQSQKRPEPKPDTTLNATAESEGITLGITLSEGQTQGGEKLDDIKDSGWYGATVTSITGKDVDGTGFTYAVNYKLPSDVFHSFEIRTRGLAKPTLQGKEDSDDKETLTADGNGLTALYRGKVYVFSDYIVDWGNAYGETRLQIAVQGGATLQDVRQGPEKAYTVYVYPTANYSWNDDVTTEDFVPEGATDSVKAVVFTFTVNPRPVNLTWTIEDYTYGDEKDHTPGAVISNLQGTDADKTNIVVTVGAKETTDDFTKAGNHTAEAKRIVTGTGAENDLTNFNYTLDGATATYKDAKDNQVTVPTGTEAINCPFVVKKRAVATPTAKDIPADGLKTNNDNQYLSFTIAEATDNTWWTDGTVQAKVSAYRPADWYTDGTGNTYFIGTATAGDTGHFANKTLTYKDAGYYVVTFAIADSANICWVGADAAATLANQTNFAVKDNYACVFTAPTITVNRIKLTAPSIKDTRILQWDGKTSQKPEPKIVTGTPETTVTFGTYDGAYKNDLSASLDTVNRGKYYVSVSVKENAFNYVWLENTAENTLSDQDKVYLGAYGKPVYIDSKDGSTGGASMYLNFAVTAQRLAIGFRVTSNSYIFGNNGSGNLYNPTQAEITAVTLANFLEIYNTTDVKDKELFESMLDETDSTTIAKQTVSIYKQNGATYTLVTDAEKSNLLPWNVGDYVIQIDVTFKAISGGESNYQDFTIAYNSDAAPKFSVEPRPIEVTWGTTGTEIWTKDSAADETNAWSVAFNNAEHVLSATVKNVPNKADGAADTSAPTLEVNLKPVNVVTDNDGVTYHTVGLNAITGNYTLTGAEETGEFGITAKIKVTPLTVTVKATAVTGHVYGDTIAGTEKAFTVTSEQKFIGMTDYADYSKYFTVSVKDSAGNAVNETTGVGTYRVVLAQNSAQSDYEQFFKNYTVDLGTDSEAEFKIVPRAISVSFDSDNATSEYGEDVDLYADGIYSTTSTNGTNTNIGIIDSDIANIRNILAFSLKDEKQTGGYVDAGRYDLECALQEGVANYTLNTSSNVVQYIVAKATIAQNSAVLVIPYGDGESVTYYDAQNHDAFTKKTDATSSVIADNTITWYVSDDNKTTWKDATTAIPQVRNAGTYTYYVKVTAGDNYIDYISENAVTVTINKATLHVSVNITIFYGEENPESVQGHAWKADVATLRTQAGENDAIRYTIAENNLKGNDSDLFYDSGEFYNLNSAGTFSYTVANYSKGSSANVGSAENAYPITLNFTGLTCDNYVFANAGGTLTVKPLELTVTINPQTATYNQTELPSLTAYGEPGKKDAYTVVRSNSTYDGTPIEAFGTALDAKNSYNDIFELVSEALHNDNSKITTNAASETPYSLKLRVKTDPTDMSKNYKVTASDSTYTITNAVLQVKEGIKGYGSDIAAGTPYDEERHLAIVVAGEENPTTIVESVDGSTVTVLYYVSETEQEPVVWDETKTSIPELIDAGTYYIYYKATAANHDDVIGHVTAKIAVAQNNIASFRFKDMVSGNVLPFTTAADIDQNMTPAWYYGLYQTAQSGTLDAALLFANTNFDLPVADFCRTYTEKNGAASTPLKIKVTLEYWPEGGIAETGEVIYTGELNAKNPDMSAIFTEISGKLNAGYYHFTFAIEGTPNFAEKSSDVIFRIGKKALTITAHNVTVTYGESVLTDTDNGNAPINPNSSATYGYAYDYTLSGNVGTDDKNNLFSVQPIFAPYSENAPFKYAPGTASGNVFNYVLKITNANDCNNLKNYTCTFSENTELTVTRREVTIEIENKTCVYNANTTDASKTFTYKLASGSLDFIDSDKKTDEKTGNRTANGSVFTLRTAALTDKGGKHNTNDVGVYPIYAVWGGYWQGSERVSYSRNYAIHFANMPEKIDEGKMVNPEIEEGTGFVLVEYGNVIIDANDIVEGKAVAILNPYYGSYTITVASLDLLVSGPYYDATGDTTLQDFVYNGRPKYYRAVLSDEWTGVSGDVSNDELTAHYYKQVVTQNGTSTELLDGAPIDVGTYVVRFTSNNDNYAQNQSGTVFSITPKEIIVTSELQEEGRTDILVPNADLTYDYIAKKRTLTYKFEGILNSDSLVLNGTANSDVARTQIVVDSDFADNVATHMPIDTATGTRTDTGNTIYTYSLTAKNAGTYKVKLKLAATMGNYTFPKNQDFYEFTFTITQADLVVWADKATIQYGTQLTTDFQKETSTVGNGADRFSGFSVTYKDTKGAEVNITDSEADFVHGRDFTTRKVLNDANSGYKADDASISVNDMYFILPGGIKAYNYNITYAHNDSANETELKKMTVVKRQVEVEVKGSNNGNITAQHVYDGNNQQSHLTATWNKDGASRAAFLTVNNGAADWYGSAYNHTYANLGITLTLIPESGASEVIHAGDYTIQETSDSVYYAVKFINSEKAQWHVEQRVLEVKAGTGAGSEFTDTFNVIYGNDATPLFAVSYGTGEDQGWVGGERLENTAVLVNSGDKREVTYSTARQNVTPTQAYKAYYSHASERYTVMPALPELRDYKVKPVAATMTVTPRPVTATIEDRDYTEKESTPGVKDYNHGESGIEHDVPVEFFGMGESILDNQFQPAATAQYAYYPKGSNTKLATAPTVAGDYTVAITFKPFNNTYTQSDYIFDVTAQGTNESLKKPVSVTESELKLYYTVNKQKYDIGWLYAGRVFDSQGSLEQNIIERFVSDIMYEDGFQRENGTNIEHITQKPETPEEGKHYYTVGENGIGLTVDAYGTGTFSIILRFNSNAEKNYAWATGGDYVMLSFGVAAERLEMTVSITGWTYDAYDPVENAPKVVLNGQQNLVSYSYATLTMTDEQIKDTGLLNVSFGSGDLSKLTVGRFDQLLPTSAGWHVVRAYYSGSSGNKDEPEYAPQYAYYIFRIAKAKVSAPIFGTGSSASGRIYSSGYSGEMLYVTIEYPNAGRLIPVIEGEGAGWTYTVNPQDATDRNGFRFNAMNVNSDPGYKITFRLQNENNYEWDAAGAKTLIWYVNKAAKAVIEFAESGDKDGQYVLYTTTYGTPYQIQAERISGFGEINYWLSPYGTVLPDDIPLAQWQASYADAGKYWVKAEIEGTSNYEGSKAYALLVIKKAELVATATGTVTYGGSNPNYRIDITGFQYGQTAEGVFGENYQKNIRYIVPDDLKADRDDYGYTIIAETETKTIDGIEQNVVRYLTEQRGNNYYVVAAAGALTVAKRDVHVTIGNGTSEYGFALALDAVAYTCDENLLSGDNLGIELDTDATPNSDVSGAYWITVADWSNKNYNVTYDRGSYTITPMQIGVSIKANGGAYNGTINPAEITAVRQINNGDADITESVKQYLAVLYVGQSDDGVDDFSISPSKTHPTHAGIFAVTVVCENDNYQIVGTPQAYFQVQQQVIDPRVLQTVPQVYTGNPVTQVEIADKETYAGMYTMDPIGTDWVNVGTYRVQLTLTDKDNVRWTGNVTTGEIEFRITRAQNQLIAKPTIAGWTYGGYATEFDAKGAVVRFGQNAIEYRYSASADGTYTTAVPRTGDAGAYWVRVYVPGTENYEELWETSEPVRFEIAKAILRAPTLEILGDGDGKNDTYTGNALAAKVLNFHSDTMNISYDGNRSGSGNDISVFATNAGTYKVYFTIRNTTNYRWADDTTLEGDRAVAEWTVARKKVAKPTENTRTFIPNGKMLTYIPEGFDESIMAIEGNQSAFGGSYNVKVTLKDPANYEWAESEQSPTEDVIFTWKIVGVNTVFVVIVSCIGGLAGVAAILAGTQTVVYFVKKKRKGSDDNDGTTDGTDGTPKEATEGAAQ